MWACHKRALSSPCPGWQRALADPSFLDHNELAAKIRALAERLPCKLGHQTWNGRHAQKHDPGSRRQPLAKGEFTEILVVRQQDA